jgi:proteic killer suppression protein
VIKSFGDSETKRIFERQRSRKLPTDVQKRVYRKLLILDAANRLGDLRATPGSRLERLGGDRAGQYSMRINDQWRLCFSWHDGEAHDVEVCDYH